MRFGHRISSAATSALLFLGATASCCVHAEGVPISVLDTDDRRAIIVRVLLNDTGAAELIEVLISDVPPRTNIADPPQMLVEYLDANQNLLGSRYAWDPLWEFVETEAGGGEQQEVLNEAIGAFDVPLDVAVRSVRISRQSPEDDGMDVELTTVDVGPAVDAFCAANPSDPGCEGANLKPIAVAGGPYEVASGASRLLDGSNSSDPDGDPITHSWDMDEDNVFGETGVSAEFGDEVGETPLFHAPRLNADAIRNVNVTLEVCDNANACDLASTLVTVLPPTLLDADEDGVPDLVDLCPDTMIPEAAPTTGQLGTNRWALTGQESFEQGPPQAGRGATFTIADTAGCSCTQIVQSLGIKSSAHLEIGCPTGLLVQWRARLSN